ncbi:alpha/beta hydrolase family protein [Mycobacterium sp. NPDC048908]|uniref:alpha/beta hydrolase family protein n=1 Tax=Mycobacterium sp. NPDC048908 TaxID=3364292 RepID=UPI00371200DB
MQTLEYGPGRAVDVIGETGPVVLMWHGAQTDARATMRPLAELVAGHGLTVAVPDWNSHAADGGRRDLLGSVEFVAQRFGPDAFSLVGWSLGGAAAAGLAINAGEFDVSVAHTICLAGAFMARSPITGAPLPTQLPNNPSPFTLLHGAADDVVPVEVSRSFAATMRDNGWPVEFVELATDHGAIAGASYDRAADRYVAADDPDVLAVAADVARRIASAARA